MHTGAVMKNKMLRVKRILRVAAFEKKEDPMHTIRLKKQLNADHQNFGKELGLFVIKEGPGFPFFLPKVWHFATN